LAAEDAVVDAVLPPSAFVPPTHGATLDMGSGGYADAPQHAGWGAPGAHAGAFEARDPWAGARPMPSLPAPGMGTRTARGGRPNGTLIALIVGGVVLLVLGIGIIGGGMFVLSRRTAARAARSSKAADAPVAAAPGAGVTPATTGTSNGAGDNGPRAQPRANDARAQGGTKAKAIVLATGALDVEGARAAVNAALPRIDACFAASELEAPNHETAAYDLDVAPSGTVTRAEPATAAGRAPRLDACVTSALRAARLPRSPGGSKVKVILTARVGDLQQAR
ncbi:MAG TPA: hypothetical protein VLT33_37750, partial [Labilithrix sp.]|nr:hypothetical protein [Labilithrix sp.]